MPCTTRCSARDVYKRQVPGTVDAGPPAIFHHHGGTFPAGPQIRLVPLVDIRLCVGHLLPVAHHLLCLLYTSRRYGLPLFVDGARLGYGVMADGAELTIPDIARLCDVFYIGGTKVGALFGEAVVIMNPALKKDFRFMMKQRGGRMAKGRLLGIQFDALFTDDLYFKISRHADEMAYQIRDIFVSAGYPLLFDSPTNQQYPIMPDDELAELGKSFGYEYWERVDETHSGVRFCASWATTQEHVDALRAAVQALRK